MVSEKLPKKAWIRHYFFALAHSESTAGNLKKRKCKTPTKTGSTSIVQYKDRKVLYLLILIIAVTATVGIVSHQRRQGVGLGLTGLGLTGLVCLG